jgi:hypothetical protein
MPALGAGIPIHLAKRCQVYRDGRAKPGHDVDGISLNYSGFKFASLTIFL